MTYCVFLQPIYDTAGPVVIANAMKHEYDFMGELTILGNDGNVLASFQKQAWAYFTVRETK